MVSDAIAIVAGILLFILFYGEPDLYNKIIQCVDIKIEQEQ